MDNFYTRTDWENSPSTKTPLNETNLNNIEDGVSELDDRVVELSHTKSSVDWVQLRKSGTKIAEVTIDGVKKDVYAPNGSGGGGGGTTDYEDLDNKPSINGVSLVGNKTNSDLGIIIPTTLAELEEDTTHRTVTDAQITKWNQGGSGGGGTAETTTYDNTTSGLDAENVQDAIDEVSEDLTQYEQTTDEEIGGIKQSLNKSIYLKNPDVKDWNAISDIGWYSGLNASNSPIQNEYINAIVIATNNNPNFLSIIAPTSTGRIFTRNQTSGVWGNWEEIPRKSDLSLLSKAVVRHYTVPIHFSGQMISDINQIVLSNDFSQIFTYTVSDTPYDCFASVSKVAEMILNVQMFRASGAITADTNCSLQVIGLPK